MRLQRFRDFGVPLLGLRVLGVRVEGLGDGRVSEKHGESVEVSPV